MTTAAESWVGLGKGRYFEGPRWHGGRLYFVDSLARKLLAMAPQGAIEVVGEIAGISGGIGIRPDGEILATSMFDRKLLRHRSGAFAGAIDLAGAAAGTIDDMIVDGHGRIFVGDLGIDLRAPERAADAARGRGRILLVEESGAARPVAEGLSFPNGIAISGDGRTLVVAESDGDCLSRYRIAPNGALEEHKRFGSFGEPDGVCFDAEDAVWVALFKEDAFVRIDLEGRELARVPVEGHRAIACALGGPGRRTLFAVTADTSHERLMRGDSRAELVARQVDVAGAGWP